MYRSEWHCYSSVQLCTRAADGLPDRARSPQMSLIDVKRSFLCITSSYLHALVLTALHAAAELPPERAKEDRVKIVCKKGSDL